MQWKLTFDPSLHHDDQREILKKPYIKKEPFAKVSIHEMHMAEMVSSLIGTKYKVIINNQDKELIISM